MQVKRTNTKITLYKLTWSDYCQLVKKLDEAIMRQIGKRIDIGLSLTGDHVMHLVLIRLQRRLSKGDHYPLKDHYLHPHFKKKFIVHLEPEEALSLWHYYPCEAGDPIRSIMNLEFPKYF